MAVCGLVSGGSLWGVAFDPRTNTASPFVNLGGTPAGEVVGIGCADPNDSKNGATNKIACAATSSNGSVYPIKFDPRVTAPAPAFGLAVYPADGLPNASGNSNCVRLNVDINQITCATETTSGTLVGYTVSVPQG